MGHFSKTYTHTLGDTAPTYGLLYQHGRLEASDGYTATNASASYGCLSLSVEFYKDLHDFLDSIQDFPYETDFVEDQDVAYTTSASVSADNCVFKIGTMQYFPYISSSGSGVAEGSQTYVPWISTDPKDYHKNSTNSLRQDIYNGQAKYGTTFRMAGNILKNASTRTYEYTLHCYYNTDFCLIGFTGPNTDKMISILTQVDATDRVGRDWYFVTSIAGYSLAANNVGTSDPFGYIEFHLKDNPKKLPTLNASGIIQLAGTAGAAPYGGTAITAAGDVYTLKSADNNATDTMDIFSNPACTITSSFAVGKFANVTASPLFFMNDFSEIQDVIVTYPIVLDGMMSLTSQVMCASDNLLLNKEYTFGGKKYYCPGDPAVTSLNMPFLFEFDTAD